MGEIYRTRTENKGTKPFVVILGALSDNIKMHVGKSVYEFDD